MSQVLIVFSDPITTEAPALLCDDAGHAVDFVSVTDAAAAATGRQFDLVVVTADPPLSTVQAVRAAAPEMPVVVVCAPVPEEIQRELHRLRVRGIVFRPYAIPTLRKLLEPQLLEL